MDDGDTVMEMYKAKAIVIEKEAEIVELKRRIKELERERQERNRGESSSSSREQAGRPMAAVAEKKKEVNSCPEIADNYKNMSRLKITEWFMPHIYKKPQLAELCKGVVYCKLLSKLFPETGDHMKRLKTAGWRNDFDSQENWKILQKMLVQMKVRKSLDMEKLVRTNHMANWEFCRWFIYFYDVNSGQVTYAEPSPIPGRHRLSLLLSTLLNPVRRMPQPTRRLSLLPKELLLATPRQPKTVPIVASPLATPRQAAKPEEEPLPKEEEEEFPKKQPAAKKAAMVDRSTQTMAETGTQPDSEPLSVAWECVPSTSRVKSPPQPKPKPRQPRDSMDMPRIDGTPRVMAYKNKIPR